MGFHGKLSMEIIFNFKEFPWKIFDGIPRGEKHENSMETRRVLW